MLEIQAVIGRIQLQHMPMWTTRRQANASRIAATCREFAALRVPVVPADVQHAFYKFYVFVEPEKLAGGWTRDRIIEEISARGVPCVQGTCSELYLEKAFDNTGYRPTYRLPVAKALGETSLMFLVHPSLSEQDMQKTCRFIREVMTMAEGAALPTSP
jgi:dTDP-4-amino-4,6-dideoxygalactose transaminase